MLAIEVAPVPGAQPGALGNFMADDWVSVGANRGVGNKPALLADVRYGDLIFQFLETQVQEVRVHGGTGVVVGQVDEEIYVRGYPHHSTYLTSHVFVREDGRWQCLVTHRW